jgi:hypothetical protein
LESNTVILNLKKGEKIKLKVSDAGSPIEIKTLYALFPILEHQTPCRKCAV